MSKPVDAEAEVVKLQELVRKLQQQNDVLRHRTVAEQQQQDALETASTCSSASILSPSVLGYDAAGPSLLPAATNNSNSVETEGEVGCKSRVAAVTVSRQQDDDTASTCSGSSCASRRRTSGSGKTFEEDNWLYRSPKQKVASGVDLVTVTPLHWMRDIFDVPSEEVKQMKKSLLSHLEQLNVPPARLSSSGSSPSIYHHLHRNNEAAHSAEDLTLRWSTAGHYPGIKQPLLLHEMGTRVDTNTFTRPKKQRGSVLARTLTVDPAVYQRTLSSGPTIQLEEYEDVDKMKDMTDVRVIARMQEASLKAQVLAGGGLTAKSRTGSQHSIASSSGGSGGDCHTPPSSPPMVRQSQPPPREAMRMPRKSLPNLGFTGGPNSRRLVGPSSSQRPSHNSPSRTSYRPVVVDAGGNNGHQRTLSTPMRVPVTGQYTGALTNGVPGGRRGSTGIPRPSGGGTASQQQAARFYLNAGGSSSGDHLQRRSPSPRRLFQNTGGHE